MHWHSTRNWMRLPLYNTDLHLGCQAFPRWSRRSLTWYCSFEYWDDGVDETRLPSLHLTGKKHFDLLYPSFFQRGVFFHISFQLLHVLCDEQNNRIFGKGNEHELIFRSCVKNCVLSVLYHSLLGYYTFVIYRLFIID